MVGWEGEGRGRRSPFEGERMELGERAGWSGGEGKGGGAEGKWAAVVKGGEGEC